MTRTFFSLAGACLVVVGAITLGANRSEPASRTDADAIKVLLNIYTQKLEEPPTDQMFGVSRIEPDRFSGHGLAAIDYKVASDQLAKNYESVTFSYGGWKQSPYLRLRLAASQRVVNLAGANRNRVERAAKDTAVSDQHPARYDREFAEAVGRFFKETTDLTNETVTTRKLSLLPVKQIILDMKKIYPSSDSCISCHPGSSKTVPIGVVGIARIAKPKE